jgi:shikimate dehydrogenase
VRRAVLLAHPAGHSLSPVMHDAAFAALGIDARYEAWDVPPAELAAAVERLRDPEILGANVTVPHKRAVLTLLDDLDAEAAAIGAVNVVRRDAGRLLGGNTDGEGFLRSLREAGLDPAGRHALLLGAGGAARAVGWALLRAGAADVRIVNRTHASAVALADALAAEAGGAVHALRDPLDGAEHVDLWVNATSVGMRRGGVDPDASPLDPAAFARRGPGATPAAAVDLVYRPRRTRFLRDAEAAGLVTLDGSGMLLHQGAAAFEAWTGRAAPLAAMRAALNDALDGAQDDGCAPGTGP